jgi:hypothetical protein
MRNKSIKKVKRSKAGQLLRILAGAAVLTFSVINVPANAVSVRYAYDSLGRITQAVFDNGTGTTTISYSYDATGNRSSVTTTSP